MPQKVRTVLKSKQGDLLAWEIDDKGDVSVRRVQSVDVEYLRAVEKTMSEWGTPEDEAVYGIYSRHDVLRVPFPFTDQSAQKKPPRVDPFGRREPSNRLPPTASWR